MFSQEEIDAVINDAQQAVSSLATDVDRFGGRGAVAAAPAVAPPRPATNCSTMPNAKPVAPDRLHRILKLKVPVRVMLAERPMRLNEILKISAGTILEFDRTVESDLDLMVGNRQIGEGIAVRANDHFGLRVTRLGDIRERLASLMG